MVQSLEEVRESDTRLFDNRISCKWFGTNEAAAYLGLTPNALRIMVHREKIKAYKLGVRLRFKTSDLRLALSKRS